MKAVVLAGGFGKRLRPLTDTIPKPLLAVGGKPILQWQIEWLQSHGVDEFILCVGHLHEKVVEFFGDGSRLGGRVHYVIEDSPLGTAGALRNAAAYFPAAEPFFVLNGDVVTNLDLAVVRRRLLETTSTGALVLVPLPSPYGVVVTDERDRITSFVEKPRLPDRWINGGVYCLNPAIESYLPKVGSVELDVFPILAAEGKLVASKHPEDLWMSIDSPKDIDDATERLKTN